MAIIHNDVANLGIIRDISIRMIRANCLKYTFDDPKLLKLVQFLAEYDDSSNVLNLYAGRNTVIRGEIRVDIDFEMPNLTYCMEDRQYLRLAKEKGWRFDTIIWDPPWNKRKSKEKFNGKMRGKFTRYKDQIVDRLNHDGIIIGIGYEIDNFGKGRGMQLQDVTVVNASGEIRPFFVTVERKMKS